MLVEGGNQKVARWDGWMDGEDASSGWATTTSWRVGEKEREVGNGRVDGKW